MHVTRNVALLSLSKRQHDCPPDPTNLPDQTNHHFKRRKTAPGEEGSENKQAVGGVSGSIQVGVIPTVLVRMIQWLEETLERADKIQTTCCGPGLEGDGPIPNPPIAQALQRTRSMVAILLRSPLGQTWLQEAGSLSGPTREWFEMTRFWK